MPSEVRHLVDRGQSYPLVRLTGVLDDDTAGPVRSTLLDVLAGQPEALVVDVTDLRVPHDDTLAGLRAVFDETRDWPATRLAFCGVDGPRWESTGWLVRPDRDAAYAALGPPDASRRVALELEPQVGAARRVRALITEACVRWERPELAGDTCIVATEMVNNVVAHARTPMRVMLARLGDAVSVAVRDESPILPRFVGPVAPTAYGGRGLLLIDSVASRWGRFALPGGKVIWARLSAERINV
ncbi:ATP-binding protein [Actinoplanes sp. HUAS TT8]|uniref:ATP-binding protein n=1 Tax=Actinoplanes sp. HUAS TT8 TaxID=3447453 RepID=UPI003F51C09C